MPLRYPRAYERYCSIAAVAVAKLGYLLASTLGWMFIIVNYVPAGVLTPLRIFSWSVGLAIISLLLWHLTQEDTAPTAGTPKG